MHQRLENQILSYGKMHLKMKKKLFNLLLISLRSNKLKYKKVGSNYIVLQVLNQIINILKNNLMVS